jgi:hypothetical protein
MFCPRCAAQNVDDAKFCRACGTNLESIALALSGQYKPARADDVYEESWLDKRREGVNKLVRAGGLLGSSLLIGAALGLFSNQSDWIIIWMVFCGWMATWGVFSLVSGVQAILESKYMREDIAESVGRTNQLRQGREQERLPAASSVEGLSPSSVTEQTTRSLTEQPHRTKRP